MLIVEIVKTPRTCNEFLLHLAFDEPEKSARQNGEQAFISK